MTPPPAQKDKKAKNKWKKLKKVQTINDLVKSDRRILQIQKNQFDATASLVYGLNISLIHFALFIMIAFVAQWPNVEMGKHLDRNYLEGQLFKTIGRDPNHIDKKMELITCESAA